MPEQRRSLRLTHDLPTTIRILVEDYGYDRVREALEHRRDRNVDIECKIALMGLTAKEPPDDSPH